MLAQTICRVSKEKYKSAMAVGEKIMVCPQFLDPVLSMVVVLGVNDDMRELSDQTNICICFSASINKQLEGFEVKSMS